VTHDRGKNRQSKARSHHGVRLKSSKCIATAIAPVADSSAKIHTRLLAADRKKADHIHVNGATASTGLCGQRREFELKSEPTAFSRHSSPPSRTAPASDFRSAAEPSSRMATVCGRARTCRAAPCSISHYPSRRLPCPDRGCPTIISRSRACEGAEPRTAARGARRMFDANRRMPKRVCSPKRRQRSSPSSISSRFRLAASFLGLAVSRLGVPARFSRRIERSALAHKFPAGADSGPGDALRKDEP
jgi:hypothetical protein